MGQQMPRFPSGFVCAYCILGQYTCVMDLTLTNASGQFQTRLELTSDNPYHKNWLVQIQIHVENLELDLG